MENLLLGLQQDRPPVSLYIVELHGERGEGLVAALRRSGARSFSGLSHFLLEIQSKSGKILSIHW